MRLTLISAAQKLRASVKIASSDMQHTIGRSADPELRRFDHLRPEAMAHMIDKFGAEPVSRWVLEMENRRKKERR